MKNVQLFTLGTVGAFLIFSAATATAAPNCEDESATKFENSEDLADWFDDENWSNFAPDETSICCIYDGQRPLIITPEYQVPIETACKEMFIEAGGTVLLSGDNAYPTTLKLGDGSTACGASCPETTIDGDFLLWSGPTLEIDGDVTINSDGSGRILLWVEGGGDWPKIIGTDAGDTLTLKGANAGSWTPDEWDDRTNTLILSGGGDIDVKLVNQAHVMTTEISCGANSYNEDRALTIKKDGSGDGFWIAETDDANCTRDDLGILKFEAAVSGSGTFVVVTSDGEIQINALPGTLTGTVRMEDGVFTVDNSECDGGTDDGDPCVTNADCATPGVCAGDFTTTGDLIFNKGTIEVAPSAGATFD